MKKLLYFTILTFMLIPFAVRAEINLEEIHDSISKENKLTIKSIPFEYYKESKFYETLKEERGEENAKFQLSRTIVESYISRNHEIPKEIKMYAGSNCNVEENVCDIVLWIDSNNNLIETYDVEFVGKYDEKIYNIGENSMNQMKSKYIVDDMEYINQVINFSGVQGFLSEVQRSSKIFKIFPELKKDLEKNPKIEYQPVYSGGGGSPITYGGGGSIVAYYDDIAIGVSNNVSYGTNKIVYIPNTTENTNEAYIQAALKRINGYINNDTYDVSIVYDSDFVEEMCGPDGIFCKLDETPIKIFKMTINDENHVLGIVPTEAKNIKKLKVESKDYKNDISVETESSDVPLDTSVKTEDVTDKHKGYLKAYNIDLYSDIKDEYITKVKNGIIVRIPMEDNYDKEYADIYHIKEDGKKGDKYKAKVEKIDGKKYAVFTTDHFSTYAIEEGTEVPNTYDGIYNYLILLFISLIGLISINMFLKKKNI